MEQAVRKSRRSADRNDGARERPGAVAVKLFAADHQTRHRADYEEDVHRALTIRDLSTRPDSPHPNRGHREISPWAFREFWAFSSNACRIAAILPSIISLGATKSAPACA